MRGAVATVTAHDRALKTGKHFERALTIQENKGGFPFSVGCSSDRHLQGTFERIDEFAEANHLTWMRWGSENTLGRSYYAGRVIGPFRNSRTTSLTITTICSIGGWTIRAEVVQRTDDQTIDPTKLLLDLKRLLETATGEQAQVK